MRPLVSVVMPVYNAQDCVAFAAQSILSQELTDLELIVVDDGSIDDTAAIIASLAQVDRRVKVIRNQCNYGIVVSLNVGIESARGTFVARQDADDLSHPERLGRQVTAVREFGVHVLGTRVKYFRSHLESADWSLEGGADGLERVSVRYGNVLAHGSVMFAPEIVKLCRYAEECVGAEDYELWLRLEAEGYSLGRLRAPLYGRHIPIRHRRAFQYYLASLRVRHRRTAYRIEGESCIRPVCETLFNTAESCYRLSYTTNMMSWSSVLKVVSYLLYPPRLFIHVEHLMCVLSGALGRFRSEFQSGPKRSKGKAAGRLE